MQEITLVRFFLSIKTESFYFTLTFLVSFFFLYNHNMLQTAFLTPQILLHSYTALLLRTYRETEPVDVSKTIQNTVLASCILDKLPLFAVKKS